MKTTESRREFVNKAFKRTGEPSGSQLPTFGDTGYNMKMVLCLNWYNSHQTFEQAVKTCEKFSGLDFSKTSNRGKVQQVAALVKIVNNGATLSPQHVVHVEQLAAELVAEENRQPRVTNEKVKVDVVKIILGEVEGAIDEAMETGTFVFPNKFASKFHLLQRDKKKIKLFLQNKIAQFKCALGEDKEYWNVRKPILRSIVKTIEKELCSI